MKRHTYTDEYAHGLESLADGARELLKATAGVAEEKVVEARARLAEALNRGKASWERVQDRAADGAKAADQTVRTHPYHAIGVALGVGALLGLVFGRRL